MSSNQLLLRYALRYPGWIVLTIILGSSSALFNGVSTTLIVPLVLGFLGKEDINLNVGPPAIQKILAFFDRGDDRTSILFMVAVVVLGIILKNVAVYLNAIVSANLSRKLVRDIRDEGLKLLLEVDIVYFSTTKIGDILNQIGNEVGRATVSIRIAINIFTTSINILIYIGILVSISWKLTIAASGLLFLVALINQALIQRAKSFGQVLSEKSSRYATILVEMLTGIRLIKAVGNEEYEYKQLDKFVDDLEKVDARSQANYDAIGPINEIVGTLSILSIVFLGKAFFWQQMESLLTVLLIYLYVLFRLLPVVSQLNAQRSQFANAAPGTQIVANFLRRDDKPFMTNGEIFYTKIKQGIRWEGVSFTYPGHDDLVLKGVDLWIPKGTTLALVGASGAGKSTMADLLPRFYDPIEGRITIDGQDLRDYNIRSLRQGMGIVSQDTFLFNNSVRYNIAYGLKNVTDEQVLLAAKRANAYEFIIQLPQGFDTEIGDRGVLLSGGQRQRLAIARALLRNPDILILDEATSALDSVSERLVQQAIDELCRDRTTIVIAHRLSTVQKASQIAVLDKGRVVELGTHEELLKKGGYYTRLYLMQFDRSANEVIHASANEAFIRASYEIRNRLNPMIGFLQLVVDDLVESSGERDELTEEAYKSAIRLLKNLELLEENSHLGEGYWVEG
ncbi:ABC transporter ATP-binding protein [Microcoleus sp. FACHB-53]|nr:ABC transporter ATP-binding protein [Microcoleus sp. FACHB-53]MBD2128683.1 ABC transporter ATP-binding protein [Microcoleus sp. FACHB-1]